MKKFKFKRLKIVEQIIIVLLGAVIIPMVASGIVINNINQHSIRKQLNESAILIAKVVSEELDVVLNTIQNELEQIKVSEEYLTSEQDKKDYIEVSLAKTPVFSSLEKVNYNPEEEIRQERQSLEPHATKIYTPMSNGNYLIATINADYLKNHVFQAMLEDERQIYILNHVGHLIISHNYNEEDFQYTLKNLPKKLETDKAVVFGNKKNQPLVYIKKAKPELTIIVNTTENLTNKTINTDRSKILLSILFSALAIILVVGFYTYYLYINIRQLFKGIIAISNGNYQRQIRLLKSIFTPFEIVFLTHEFNKMAEKIHSAYIELQDKNEELKRLDKFRSNLIDTVSHEFRTPLTSIQGYTSRLLRQDIKIDEETKQKSLRTIKRQSERLSRMVEDLLIVPDIDGARINVKLEPVSLNTIIDYATTFMNGIDIQVNIDESIPIISADKDRIEQVLINLLENAKKYATENTPVVIDTERKENSVYVYVKNQCDKIPEDKINTLFEKFIRIDSETTRTTRGTGLGLFIVKGLVEAMGGEITLHSNDDFGFIAEMRFKIYDDETST
ncbi:GHKL domain-containing protein [bacterium]|nr:GHKL domain-containing protein [bacterium]